MKAGMTPPANIDIPVTVPEYQVRIDTDTLNVRAGAGTGFSIVGTVKRGDIYTIIAESDGAGAKKWGKLKSGAGFISLDFTVRLMSAITPEPPEPTPEPTPPPAKDTPSAWAAASCKKAVESGLVTGDGMGWYGWKEQPTFERMIVLLDNMGLIPEARK